MTTNKIERKNTKRIIKKLIRELDNSPLNPFIKHYYLSLKEDQISSNREAVIDKIKYNNKLINQLKREISNNYFCDIHKKIINEYIEDLEYQNGTSKEIIKFLDIRIQENLYQKKQKKFNKIFKKNSKLSETT